MESCYSIKDLSQLTRIKPHTLRIWEQRYGIMKPERSDTNIRKYNDDDLKYLLNISVLYDNGFKISSIAKLSREDLSSEVKKLSQKNLNSPSQVPQMIVAMLEMDEDRFENLFTTYILSHGLETAMTSLVFPFLQQVGTLWQTNTINPAQEHFTTNIIRKKLFVAIDGLCPQPHLDQKKIILFLPEGELHEMGLLFTYFIAKARGHKVIYLGQSLPMADLASVQKLHQADIWITIITSVPSGEEVQPYLENLSKIKGDARILISGFQVLYQPVRLPKGFHLVHNPDELGRILTDTKELNKLENRSFS